MKNYIKPTIEKRIYGVTDAIAAIPTPPGFSTNPALDSDIADATTSYATVSSAPGDVVPQQG